MIIISFLTVLLGSCGFLIGSTIVARVSPDHCFSNAEDHAFVSTWVGILVLANSWLALSLFTALSPAGVLAVTVLAGFFLVTQGGRICVGTTAGKLPADLIPAMIPLVLGVGAYCSQVIVWYDTRLYHVQAIKWLSRYGLVPGLALIHERFGFISSWFAPAAAFNHGLLEGRIASLPGAFSLTMLVAHLLVAIIRLLRRQGKRSDLFLVAAYIPALAVIMLYGLPNSAAPDLPVIILTIVTAWSMMIVADSRGETAGTVEQTLNAALVPLLLAAGAVSIKPSALPLLAVAGCFYLLNGKLMAGKLAVSAMVLIFFLGPLAAAGLVTSGCAFYPAPAFCTSLPWSVGGGQAAAESKVIRDWARWGEEGPPVNAGDWNWIMPWFRKEWACSLLLLFSAVAATAMLKQRAVRRAVPGSLYLLVLAGTGTAFLFYAAPTWRFGLGYMVLLPALLAVMHGERLMHLTGRIGCLPFVASAPFIGTLTAIVLASHIYFTPRPTFLPLEQFAAANPAIVGSDRPHFNLLLPPRLWSLDFETDPATGEKRAASPAVLIRDHLSDFIYYRPDPEKSELCSDAALPCSPVKLHDIRLHDRGRGIAGGFVRDANSADSYQPEGTR